MNSNKALRVLCSWALAMTLAGPSIAQAARDEIIPLPPPRHDGRISVEKAISQRRSVREYDEAGLSLVEISQILWAAQGFTQEKKDPPRMWNPKAKK